MHFFERGGGGVAKGVCKVAKLATLCISISPTTGWATGRNRNVRYVNHALIKLVPLKLVNKISAVNVLTLTALYIYIYIYIFVLSIDKKN